MVGLTASRSLGRFLAYRRDLAGISQADFAEKLGWSAATLSRVERGLRSLVNDGEVYMVANALGVTVEEFLQGVADETTGAAVGEGPNLGDVLDELRATRAEVSDLRAALARIEEGLSRPGAEDAAAWVHADEVHQVQRRGPNASPVDADAGTPVTIDADYTRPSRTEGDALAVEGAAAVDLPSGPEADARAEAVARIAGEPQRLPRRVK